MAYQAFTLVANFLGNVSGATTALSSVRQAALGARQGLDAASRNKIEVDTGAGLKAIGAVTAGVHGLQASILSLIPINLESVLSVATLAGVASGIKSVITLFMSLNDNLQLTTKRFEAMGFEGAKMADEFTKFSKVLANTAAIGDEAARKLAVRAFERGPDPANYQAVAKAAAAISARTGMSVDQTIRLVNLGEENYRNYFRLLKLAGLQVQANASQAEVMRRVNLLIDQGTQIQKTAQQTFEGRIVGLENAFLRLREAVSRAMGPVLAEVLTDAITYIQGVVEWTTQWVISHKQLLAQVALVVKGVVEFALVIGALVGFMRIATAVFSALRLISIATAVAQWALRLAVMGVTGALRGLVSTIPVVGLLLAIAGAVLQASGAFDDLQGTFTAVVNFFGNAGKSIMAGFQVVWKFVATEAQVAWEMLMMSWDGIYAMLVSGWEGLEKAFDATMKYIFELFGGTWGGVKQTWEVFVKWAKSTWDNLLAELSVIDIRIQQAGLAVIIAWKEVVATLNWAWDTFKYFVKWMNTGWTSGIVFAIKVWMTSLYNVAMFIAQIFTTIIGWFRSAGEAISDLIEINEQWTKKEESESDKNKRKEIIQAPEDKRPDLDEYLKKAGDKERAQIAGLEAEANKRKTEALDKQAKLRNALDAAGAVKREEFAKKEAETATPEHLKGRTVQRASFSSMESVWKKLQEQVAGGQMRDALAVAKEQVGEQRTTNSQLERANRLLEELKKSEGKGSGDVVPK